MEKAALEGCRRRPLGRNNVLEGSRDSRERFSAEMLFWKTPGGARSAKILLWRPQKKVWFWDECLQRAQRPPEGNTQKNSFPWVLQYFQHSRRTGTVPELRIPVCPESQSPEAIYTPEAQGLSGLLKAVESVRFRFLGEST